MFGVSSDKSEAAKTLLYPHPSAADMAEVTDPLVRFLQLVRFTEHRKNTKLDAPVGFLQTSLYRRRFV